MWIVIFCGSLQEAPTPEDLTDVVYVKKLHCHDQVETTIPPTLFVYCSVDLPVKETKITYLSVRNARRSPRNPRNSFCVQHSVCTVKSV